MGKSMTKDIDVTLGRSCVYQLLKTAFLYPDEELATLVRDGALVRDMRAGARRLVMSNKSKLLKAIQNLESAVDGLTVDDLQEQHGRVFGHTISKECPAYETEYGGPHIFRQTQELGDISGFYTAFGLEVSDTNKERLDHISTELEFMHFLTYKEVYAREHHSSEKIDICREAQKQFFKEHLGRWAPLFLKRLAEKAQSGFYKELAQLTESFLVFEVEFLDVKAVT
jgi:DMSO reductase family type II enzyme chaperone